MSDGGTIGSKDGDFRDQSAVPKLLSSCPKVMVNMGGVNVECLLDTGSMVTTISEKLFKQHFQMNPESLKACHWLQLRAANGLEIPYVGYLELNIKGKFFFFGEIYSPAWCLSCQRPAQLPPSPQHSWYECHS